MLQMTIMALAMGLGALAAVPSDDEGEYVEALTGQWIGDLDGMLQRERLRALVPYSKTYYFLDGGTARGATYDLLQAFEKFLNERHPEGRIPVRIVVIPTPRDQLIPRLLEGYGDLAAGYLTITEARGRQVDFGDPLLSEVREIVVSGPGAPQLRELDDLSGQTVHVRRSSSYYESLVELNRRFSGAGRAPVNIVLAHESLEDEDLLELVNSGLIAMIVVDDHKAGFWAQSMDRIQLHEQLALREGGEIAWAVRPGSPKLTAEINAFVAEARKGTLLGNVVHRRYLEENPWVSNPLPQREIERIERKLELFRHYGERYDFDWTMLAALAYQESGLDQSKRSAAGAVGVMQILPSTGADPNVDIVEVQNLENNIHAGTKYLSFLRQRYFSGPELDRVNAELFALAAYNAGPARIAELREETASRGLDPNLWFQNVEVLAARRIGQETVRYVSNIFKYYIAYSSLVAQQSTRDAARVNLETEAETASVESVEQ